jgi:hypothetical protein
MVVGEPPDEGGERFDAGRGHGDQLDRAPLQALYRVHRGSGGAQVAEHLAGRFDQLPAGVAEHDPATDAVEQPHTELPLESGDGLGQRGLGDVQVLCGPDEPVVVDDGEEVLELPGVHDVSRAGGEPVDGIYVTDVTLSLDR